MTKSAADLKAHLRRVGEVKSSDANAVPPATPGAGIEQTILHSDEHLDGFGAHEDADDTEFETWLRVNEYLGSLSP